ncbi:MAG: cbb3-type cytochrome c oxidase subunit 3 [Gammaproteobacteria bacterium]
MTTETLISSTAVPMEAIGSGVITLILMIVFACIALWAWSDKPKSTFREAERLPLEEDNLATPNTADTRTESTHPTPKIGRRFS